MSDVILVTEADAGLLEGCWERSNSWREAKMAKNLDHFRLSVSDPWEVVAGAREQRGAIVARWCVALLAFLWIRRPRADVVQQRRIPADLAARAAVPGTSETAGQQGAGI